MGAPDGTPARCRRRAVDRSVASRGRSCRRGGTGAWPSAARPPPSAGSQAHVGLEGPGAGGGGLRLISPRRGGRLQASSPGAARRQLGSASPYRGTGTWAGSHRSTSAAAWSGSAGSTGLAGVAGEESSSAGHPALAEPAWPAQRSRPQAIVLSAAGTADHLRQGVASHLAWPCRIPRAGAASGGGRLSSSGGGRREVETGSSGTSTEVSEHHKRAQADRDSRGPPAPARRATNWSTARPSLRPA